MILSAKPTLLSVMAATIFAAAIAAPSAPALAQVGADTPRELRGVDITEHLDTQLPLDLEFTDAEGNRVTLGDYFQPGRPVIITLNYYRCPMLCTLQLNFMVDALAPLEFTPGEDFQIVTISFDPDEGPGLALPKKKLYADAYSLAWARANFSGPNLEAKERNEKLTALSAQFRPKAENWAFLTGDAASVKAITEAIGFGYRWNEKTQEWAHTAALFIATPEGRLSRYLYGIEHQPKNVRMALLEASDGRIGTTVDRFIMWCYHYDDSTGQYTADVMNIMRLMGALTVAALATGIFILWRRDVHRRVERDFPPARPAHQHG